MNLDSVTCWWQDEAVSRGPFQWVCITLVLRCVCCLPSVWTQESTCHLIEANVKDHDELEGKKVPRYPCLWVNVSVVGQWAMLYHTEDTQDQNQQVMKGDCVLALTDL